MKKHILYFDTETTGNAENDYLIQIAYKDDVKKHVAYFKPPIPIQFEAMAVHHITEKMVADKPAFKFSNEYDELHTLAHDGKTVFVAHNAPFDLKMLTKEGIVPEEYICTLRVARQLDTEEKIPSYRLQFLRYFLGIDIEADAHDAMGDVLVLEKLFERLMKKIMEKENVDEDRALELMIEISSHPSLLTTFKFGKYKGQKIAEVMKTDRGYLEWMLAQKSENPSDDEDLVFSLKKYLGKM